MVDGRAQEIASGRKCKRMNDRYLFKEINDPCMYSLIGKIMSINLDVFEY